MKLLVIRHAVAMERDHFQSKIREEARIHGATGIVEADDDFRPLTPDGEKKMRKNGKGLRRLARRPDLLVTSPLTRAVQTADVLREVAWPDMDLATSEHLRPGAEPGALCKWLMAQPQAASNETLIALVGHEPHLSSLVGWLMCGSQRSTIELKKGGACFLEFPAAFEKGRGKLAWLATPNLLRASR